MRRALSNNLRPYICHHCRLRIASSTRRALQTNPSEDKIRGQSEHGSSPVVRRIQDLGGKEKAQELYNRVTQQGTSELLSAASFGRDMGYFKEWQANLDEEWRKAQDIVVYGRVNAIRQHGRKLAFVEVTTGGYDTSKGNTAQIMLNVKNLIQSDTTEEKKQTTIRMNHFVSKMRRGDWISIRGRPEFSDTSRWQLRATHLPTFLAPALQTVPVTLDDEEFRMRNRHADQIVNSAARDMIFLRHKFLAWMREYFSSKKFVEVNTPLLGAGAGGATARPFETVATEFSDMTLSLRVAPELYLKRLIVGGMPRIFEVGPAFRNEGVDLTHNPEFTIVEFYGVMLSLPDLMSMTEEIFQGLGSMMKDYGKTLESIPHLESDFASPFAVLEFIPELSKAVKDRLSDPSWIFPDCTAANVEQARTSLLLTFERLELSPPASPTLPRLLDALASHFLEPQCKAPTFIVNQPECMAPLAKSYRMAFAFPEGSTTEYIVSARAELFIQGREYVNCYEEENSPIEQRRKFMEQIQFFGDGEENEKEVDMSYIHALEWGMPPTGGWGCGFDRLLMLFGGKKRIADVLPFGTLRNVVAINPSRQKGTGLARKIAIYDQLAKEAKTASQWEQAHALDSPVSMIPSNQNAGSDHQGEPESEIDVPEQRLEGLAEQMANADASKVFRAEQGAGQNQELNEDVGSNYKNEIDQITTVLERDGLTMTRTQSRHRSDKRQTDAARSSPSVAHVEMLDDLSWLEQDIMQVPDQTAAEEADAVEDEAGENISFDPARRTDLGGRFLDFSQITHSAGLTGESVAGSSSADRTNRKNRP